MLLVVLGLATPAQAATGRSISVAAAPTSAFGGISVVIHGGVTHSPTGSLVKIQRLVGSTWLTVVNTRTTTAGGAYSARTTLPATAAVYSYRAQAPATSRLARTTSATVHVTSLRHVAISFDATPSSIVLGASTTVGGSVAPTASGTRVTIQRLSGSTWVTVGTTAVTSVATYSLVVVPSGTTTYRAVVAQRGINASATSAPATVRVTTSPAPTITTTTLPDATRGAAYTTTLTKSGQAGTWSIQGLPAGLSLDPATGVISGIATTIGTYGVYPVFTETATGRQAFKALALHVIGTPVAVTTTSLPDGAKGAPYSVALTKTGGAGTWSSATLPDGLSLDPATGVLSGTPTSAGDFGIYVAFTETSTGSYATGAFALRITAPAVTTASLPDGAQGVPYSLTLTKTGGPGTWSSEPLPDGLSLDPATGVLSGTPTSSGDYAVYVVFTETATGSTAYGFYALHITGPAVTTTSLPDGTTGQAYSQQLTKAGGDGTWAYTSGNLPAGVTLSADGLLSGAPEAAGDYVFDVTFTETATSAAASRTLLLHVADPGSPVINTTTLPDGTVGTPYSATLSAEGDGTWAPIYGALPDGLTVNEATGEISGTPTTAGDSYFIVRFTTATGTNTKALAIHVAPAAP
ncbi:MAG: Ig family protein [Marmoricola sp.]|nr:Ig family protein [Marmoricola sp.]